MGNGKWENSKLGNWEMRKEGSKGGDFLCDFFNVFRQALGAGGAGERGGLSCVSDRSGKHEVRGQARRPDL